MVWFTNDERGLVLNKTNNRTSAAPSATTSKAGPARSSSLFPTMAEFRGKMVPGLAGAHPAAEAGHCRKRPGDGTVGKAEADNGRQTLDEPEPEPPAKPAEAELPTTSSTTRSRFDRA